MNSRWLSIAVVTVVVLLFAIPVWAFYPNQPPDLNGDKFVSSPNGELAEAADDFVAQVDGLVTRVQWWGGPIDYDPGDPEFTEFNLYFYRDGGCAPSDTVREEGLVVIREYVGDDLNGDPIYRYEADVMVPVSAGETYWFSALGYGTPPSYRWGRLQALDQLGCDGMVRGMEYGYEDWASLEDFTGEPTDLSQGFEFTDATFGSPWYFDDDNGPSSEWGHDGFRWERMHASALENDECSFADLPPPGTYFYRLAACTYPEGANYSGYHMYARIWFEADNPGNVVDLAISRGAWGFTGLALGAASVELSTGLNEVLVDFGTIDSDPMFGDSIVLTMGRANGTAWDVRVHFDSDSCASGLYASADVGYSLTQELTGVKTSDSSWGDIDDDGDLDLVYAGESDAGYVTMLYRNDEGIMVGQLNDLPGVISPSSGNLVWGDYDNDGDLDLFLGGMTQASERIARIYNNDGTGALTWDTGQILAGLAGVSAAWGDVDQDGDLDLAVQGHDGSVARTILYKNDPLGTLTEDPSYDLDDLYSGSVDWADWDADGDLDLLATGYDGAAYQTVFHVNEGAGKLTSDGNHGVVDVGLSDVAWGDYDADGDLDLAVSGEQGLGGPRTSRIYNNDGSGVLTDVGATLPTIYRSACAWGDYDADGDLDVAFHGYTGSVTVTHIYENTGSGFEVAYDHFPDLHRGSINWVDVDQDGRLDFFITGSNYPGTKFANLYKRVGGVANSPPDPPIGFATELAGGGIRLSWVGANDVETPDESLYYCLRVGTTQEADDICSGAYATPLMGNMMQATEAVVALPAGTYYWQVRSIDSGLAPSEWSTVQQVIHAAAGVEEPELSPTSLRLRAAPNPFPQQTVLSYQVPMAGELRIEVFDASGRLVRRLHEGFAPAGTGIVTWNGLNDHRLRVAGGTYYCRIRSGDRGSSRTVVLLP